MNYYLEAISNFLSYALLESSFLHHHLNKPRKHLLGWTNYQWDVPTLWNSDKLQQPLDWRTRGNPTGSSPLCLVKHQQAKLETWGPAPPPYLRLQPRPAGTRVPQLQHLAALGQWHLLAPSDWKCSLPETVGSGNELHCHTGLAPQSRAPGNR